LVDLLSYLEPRPHRSPTTSNRDRPARAGWKRLNAATFRPEDLPTQGIRTVLITDVTIFHRTHVEDAWVAGQQRAAERLKGLVTP